MSSANFSTLLDMSSSKSFIYIKKSIGPNIDPCGTPLKTGFQFEISPSTITQSPIGRNIAVIRHRYAIYVLDINVNHVLRQCLFSQPELTGIAWCILELLRVSNNEIDLPGFTKNDVNNMINALCTC